MKQQKYLVDYPELMLDWAFDLNPDSNPAHITHGSHKMIVWRCHKCGRVWSAKVKNRTAGTGCICDAKVRAAIKLRETAVNRQGSLRQTQPIVADLWHPNLNGDVKPEDVTENARFNAWWINHDGEVWQAPVWYVCRRMGVPNPKKFLAEIGVNDLGTKRPDLEKEWDFEKNKEYDIRQVKSTANLMVWWRCRKGHEWQATIASRNQNKHNCPICNKEKSTSFPEQAVFYYIRQAFPDAVNRYCTSDGSEIDVYVPTEKIAIEYDGSYGGNALMGINGKCQL